MRTRINLVISLCTAALLLAPATASAYFPHTISTGESLYSVAAADGLSVSQLAAANGLSPDSQLTAGSTLLIPPQTSAPAYSASSPSGASGDVAEGETSTEASTASASTVSTGLGDYVVQPGDTLSAIAARAGVSVSSLAAANGLDPNGLLLAGRSLRVSGVSGGVSSSSSSAATSQPVGASAQGSSSGGPYPTAERVSASEIGSIASSEGVSPSLAAAIGYQESGFNNGLTSSADARGVMQILPGTWDWIRHSLSMGQPLSSYSAADNVRGGVLLLRSLLRATGGDPALAAAGYYQGLPSVRAHGMYSDTQRYVNNVLALKQRFGG